MYDCMCILGLAMFVCKCVNVRVRVLRHHVVVAHTSKTRGGYLHYGYIYCEVDEIVQHNILQKLQKKNILCTLDTQCAAQHFSWHPTIAQRRPTINVVA